MHRHWTHMLKELLNAFGVYSVESVSKMWLVLSVTFCIFAIYGVVSVQQIHSRSGDRKDIFLTLIILLYLFLSTNRKHQPSWFLSYFACLGVWGGSTIIFSQLFHIYPGKVFFHQICTYLPDYWFSHYGKSWGHFFFSITAVESMMCANNQVHYDLKVVFVYLYITLSLCYHYTGWRLWTY